MAELLLYQTLPVFVVLQRVGQNLNQREMLIQSRLDFLLVAENMVEAGRQLGSAFPVEHDLAGADVAVSHSLVVHEVKCAEHLLGQMLQDGFWYGSYALGQVVKAAVRGVILNHRYASFGTVPLG